MAVKLYTACVAIGAVLLAVNCALPALLIAGVAGVLLVRHELQYAARFVRYAPRPPRVKVAAAKVVVVPADEG